MTRSSNRDIEQHYFDQFRAHFPLPAGEVEHGDKPDVIIHGERKLGIEIANLYLTDGADHSSEQVQRQRREAVVREAQKLHALAGGRNIELTVSFNPDRPIAEVKDLANALARVAYSTQHLPVGLLARQHFERTSAVFSDGAARVSRRQPRPGLGKLLMGCAVDRCLQARKQVAAFALIVDARNEIAKAFYEHYGFSPCIDSPMTLYLPLG